MGWATRVHVQPVLLPLLRQSTAGQRLTDLGVVPGLGGQQEGLMARKALVTSLCSGMVTSKQCQPLSDTYIGDVHKQHILVAELRIAGETLGWLMKEGSNCHNLSDYIRTVKLWTVQVRRHLQQPF